MADKAKAAARAIGGIGKKWRRSSLAAALRRPMLRVRRRGGSFSQLVIVPPDLRAHDPTFADELRVGQLGLAGTVADVSRGSIFDVVPPTHEWAKEREGFGWLRHLRGDDDGEDADWELVPILVAEWIERNPDPVLEPEDLEVTARRIISWLSSVRVILDEAEPEFYESFMQSLEMQVLQLEQALPRGPVGVPRLTGLIAIVMAGLCIADQDALLGRTQDNLLEELDKQILPFGGHVSRNPAALVEVLLDLLPLTKCFSARGLARPEQLTATLDRCFPWLNYMRLGDGQLARFNGCGPVAPASLATVLAYDTQLRRLLPSAGYGYVRLEGRNAVLVMDTGRAPPAEHASLAHAGALSFEMSAGTRPLIVNCGAPGAADLDWCAHARSTAAHSTLSLEGSSSGRLVTASNDFGMGRDLALIGPAHVTATVGGGQQRQSIEATHDAYLEQHGLVHWRGLMLSDDGARLDGCDRLFHPQPKGRIRGDVAYGIHFHVHPDVSCMLSGGGVELRTTDGQSWRFESKNHASMSIEESIFLGGITGPVTSMQIVLRGRCLDGIEVHWRFQKS